ncbi:hydrophobe/amphiphile efflux-3 (HAE3) family transporter [Archaeoglobus profundus]|uniref:Efflux transporter, hydrophobe/amphiphile efflux-3 (HAE3) family n=1 Tax=Archaeoglobus profundus (strain DSM 5631 / JCM 9629 / NBRC 100127 / Av18) TaxID=572546 RepID=D2RGV3_ARCPA|nr:hydrophobe/amphiphile efflux-3 (HAE3) family transporter [Archaeoglobus profundus]ADB57528.1 efflux transporter, hydrophobe/amphiphile efflux-3 (HAE3) family [Archaeoglobus profundus DSM 5631]
MSFEDFLEKVSRFVAKRPGFIVSVTALVVIIFLISASQTEFTSLEYKNMFPIGDPVYKDLELYQKDFGIRAEGVYIMIKGDDVVNREVYEYMLKLGENLKNIDGVGGVTSPASIIAELNGGVLPSDNSQLKRLTELYAYHLVPKKTLALISITITVTDPDKTMELAEQIERVVKFTDRPTGITAEVTGSPVLSYQITQTTQKETGMTTMASIIAMIILLIVTFSGAVRKKYTAFMPLVISVFSVIVVVGLLPLTGIKLDTMISASLPILIGLAIEYAAQIQNRYEHERMRGVDRDNSIVISVTKTGLAVILAMITTVIGFMSMATTLIPEFAIFGGSISLGLVIAYIFSITSLPAILKILDKEETTKVKEKKEVGILEKVLTSIASLTASKPKAILALALIIVIVGAYANTQIELETDTKKYFPENLPAMVKFNELEEVMGKQYIYTVVLSVDEVGVDELKRLDELGNYIVNKEDMVYRCDSLSSLIKEYLGKLPESDAELSTVLSMIPKDVLKRYISGHTLALYLYTSADTHDKRVELTEYLKRDVRFFEWHEGYYITGQPAIMAHLGEIMLNSQTQMTLVSYGLIVLLLFATYRSITRAVVPLVAITTVIGVLNTTMFAMGMKQTFMSIAINSITLGLGIDFSIHMAERYAEERQKYSPEKAVTVAIEETGKAIVTSALTMAGGFGALMLSSFPMLWNFGFLSVIAIIFSLIGALTVVPAFLMIVERFRRTDVMDSVANALSRAT